MNVKIHEPSKIVEVMLTHAEQARRGGQAAAQGAVRTV